MKIQLSQKTLDKIQDVVKAIHLQIDEEIEAITDNIIKSVPLPDDFTKRLIGKSAADAILIIEAYQTTTRKAEITQAVKDAFYIEITHIADTWLIESMTAAKPNATQSEKAKEIKVHIADIPNAAKGPNGKVSPPPETSEVISNTKETIEIMGENTIRSTVINRIPETSILKILKMEASGDTVETIQKAVKLSEAIVVFCINEYSHSKTPVGIDYHNQSAVKKLYQSGYTEQYIAVKLRVALADVKETIEGITEFNIEESTVMFVNSMKDDNDLEKIVETTQLRKEVVESILKAS